MDLTNVVLGAVLIVMLANQLVMRGGREVGPPVFWGLQSANVVVAAAVVLLPLDSLARWPMVPWIIALLLAVHVMQNLSLRARWADQARRDARIARDEALLAKARRDEAEASDRDGSVRETPPG